MSAISPYLVVIVLAWVCAQGLKYLLAAIREKNVSVFRQLYLSGNMPSAHSAAVMSLTTLIALKDGTHTPLFALAALFAAIVMYDAIMVRRSSGEQGLAIRDLITELKSGIVLPRAAKGHTPLEVLAGATLGVILGIMVFLTTV